MDTEEIKHVTTIRDDRLAKVAKDRTPDTRSPPKKLGSSYKKKLNTGFCHFCFFTHYSLIYRNR